MTEQLNAYMRKYSAQRYPERRAWALAILGGVCVECGTDQDLEFDHIDPATKSFEVPTRFVTGSEATLLEELAKCELRCKLHHQLRTTGQQQVEHGGGRSGRKNCPCKPCHEKKAQYMREWKAERKARATC